MKLFISPAELAEGKTVQRIGEKRMYKFTDAIRQKEFVILSNGPVGPDQCRAALLTEIKNVNGALFDVFLLPVLGRAWFGCHLCRTDVRTIVAELPDGQWTFTNEGKERSRHTVSGPGVDPCIDPAADFVKALEMSCGAARQMRAHILETLLVPA